MKAIRIAVLGDDKDHINSFKRLLAPFNEICVEIQRSNSAELLRALNKISVTIVCIIETSLTRAAQGITSIRDLRPDLRTIIISNNEDETSIITLNSLGVKSHILKVAPIEEIIWAIRTVDKGGYYFPDTIGKMLQRVWHEIKQSENDLNEFDYSVLKLTVKGLSSSKISEILHRSPRTIEDHRQKLYNIFRVKNKVELIVLATKYNLI
ncbi:response regulator transcription factor [Flammeovirgaceae bacterium]